MPAPQEVTQLLLAWSEGDEAALERLIPLVHDELHRLAGHYRRRESAEHTLQTTAIVNEAYLRLVNARLVSWENRSHFFAICARLMRQILVDFARRRAYRKRGGDVRRVELDQASLIGPGTDPDLVALDEALHVLNRIDPRKSQVVELRFFGGLNTEEVAHVLNVSPGTVKRDWRFAKAWLRSQLQGDRS